LAQRNAALRVGAATEEEFEAWEVELADAAGVVHALRESYVGRLAPTFQALASQLVDAQAELSYVRGWSRERPYRQILAQGRGGDAIHGATRFGPHRADLTVDLDSHRARWRASRGQQKLLGAALVLSQAKLVAEARRDRIALLLDEPNADLDSAHLSRYVTVLRALPAQLVIASLEPTKPLRDLAGAVFHVEHGVVKALL
jgi:DNA replication and repair protein RecF